MPGSTDFREVLFFPLSLIKSFRAGNPYPPLVFNGARNRYLIHNVLLDEARKEYRREQQSKIAEQVSKSEKEQKQMQTENVTTNESNSKAAQEVSESEQLLKVVAPEMEESSEEVPEPAIDESSKGNSTSTEGKEFNPVILVGL